MDQETVLERLPEVERNYDFFKTSLIIIASALLFLTVGSFVQHKGFAFGVVVTEYLIVMLPVLLAGWYMKVDFKKALHLNPIKIKTALKIMCLALTALPTIYFANFMMVVLLIKLDRFYQVDIPMPKTAGELGISLILIAFSAGLCEELMFRGMVMNAYEARYGKYWAVICPALIFGMFHFNPLNFFGPVILGLLFGYLVLSTNSIFSSMVAHMTNNGIAVLFAYVANLNPTAGSSPEAGLAALEKIIGNPTVLITMIVVLLLFALMMAIPGYFLFKSIRQDGMTIKEGEQLLIKSERYLVESVNNEGIVVQKLTESMKSIASSSRGVNVEDADESAVETTESAERFLINPQKMASYKPVVITPLVSSAEKALPKWQAWVPVGVFFLMYIAIATLILQRAAEL